MIALVYSIAATIILVGVPVIWGIGWVGFLIEFAIAFIAEDEFDAQIDLADDSIFIYLANPLAGVTDNADSIAELLFMTAIQGFVSWSMIVLFSIFLWPAIIVGLTFTVTIVQLKSKRQYGHFLTIKGLINKLKND